MFENSFIKIIVKSEPVSLQNKENKKKQLKEVVHSITKNCPYIITSHCWIHIDYYCNHIRREKNLSSYDMDNLLKPMLDSLTGSEGLIIDDSLFDRVEINWIDNGNDDFFEISIEYSEFLYCDKKSMKIYRNGNWCFPIDFCDSKIINMIKNYFKIWNKIETENDYYDVCKLLPTQPFLPYNKVCKSGFEIEDINNAFSNNFVN